MVDLGTYLLGAGSLLTAALVGYHNWHKDRIGELKSEITALHVKTQTLEERNAECETRYAALQTQLTTHLIDCARHMVESRRERQ